MKNITILVPIHNLENGNDKMLENALLSVEPFYNDVKVLIICPDKIKTKIRIPSEKLEIKVISHKFTTDFCTQINFGIDNVNTKWFSILEIDDEYKPVWLSSMNSYIKEYTDVDVFLPVVKDVNVNGDFVGFTNESTWAYGFTEKQGFLDNEVLLEFQNYQTSGALYKTSTIKSLGKFKDNIKLTFSYEFLLRLTHNDVKIMTVPRIGYQHVKMRENALFWLYKNDEKFKINEDEVKFWIDTAKKEFFFKTKRDIELKN